MVIKSTSIKDIKGIRRTVEYCLSEQKNAELIYSRYLPRNADINRMVQELEANEKLRLRRRKDSVILFHDIVSFHHLDSDKIQDEQLRELALRYADMRKDAMNITVLHKEDSAHTHLHIISSGVEYGIGKATRISKAKFNEQKQLLQDYEDREMKLEHSHIDHSKKK